MGQRIYKRILIILIVTAVAGMVGFLYHYINYEIPEYIRIEKDEMEKFNFRLPVSGTINSDSTQVVLGTESNIAADQINMVLDQDFSIYSDNVGTYKLDLNILGLFRLKSVTVDVVEDTKVIACGTPVGILLESDGIMVIGTSNLKDEHGNEIPSPAEGLVQTGDYIIAVNGIENSDKNMLVDAVNKSNGHMITLKIRREHEIFDLAIAPHKYEDGTYKLGLWVRDDTQGIGTLTYIAQDGSYGALGHCINDSDSGSRVEIESGKLYASEIRSVIKATFGTPGSLAGIICYGDDNYYGTITGNTPEGIFGYLAVNLFDDNNNMSAVASEDMNEIATLSPISICSSQNIELGKAYIRSNVSGQIKDYEIEITKLDYSIDNQNKGIVLKVTDPELIELTGGIVQGMSGSPIIQNNELIGAVTHVFIQDSTRGYGIFIEKMLKSQESCPQNL